MSEASTAPDRADRRADLRALAWVREELRLSLEQAHKSLRRYLRESLNRAEGDIVDPAILRTARQALHQVAGALELVGQPAAAHVVAASEAAVVRFIADGALVTSDSVGSIERGSFAVLDFLAHVLAGKRVSTLALFPQYRALQELARAERVHPADLWSLNWRWAALPEEPGVEPAQVDGSTRGQLETLMLSLMRQPDRQTLARLSELSASLGAGTRGDGSTLWKLAAAFFEAQAAGALRPDVYAKRIAPRLLALARSGQPAAAVQQQLARDLLFFCAQAQPARASRPVPRLEAARGAFGLGHEPVQDYENPRLGRFDPMWITQARRRIGAARDVWSAVGAGELHHLPALAEQFALVGDSLQRLLPEGAALAAALSAAAREPVDADGPPSPAVAMEVATLLLVLEATLEAADVDHPGWPQRVPALVERLRRARQPGAVDEAPEPWMGRVYRAVSDRRTALAVSQELRLALAEVEKQLDQFVRQPTQVDLLETAQPGLRTIQGVLAMLGLDDAAAGVGALARAAAALERGDVAADSSRAQALFESMATNLGVLGVLFDVFAVQPEAARLLLRFDPQRGELVRLLVEEPATPSAPEVTPLPTPVQEQPAGVQEQIGAAADERVPPVARVAESQGPALQPEPQPDSQPEPAPLQAVGTASEVEIVEAVDLAEIAEIAEIAQPAEAAETVGTRGVDAPAQPTGLVEPLEPVEPIESAAPTPPPGKPLDTTGLPVLELLLEPEQSRPSALAPLPEMPDLPVLTEAITRPVPIDDSPAARPLRDYPESGWDEEEYPDTLPVPMVEELGSGSFDDFPGLGEPGARPPADALKVVGPLTLEIGAFNRFLNDADEAVRELAVRLGEWGVVRSGVPDARCVELAQALAAQARQIGQLELAHASDALAQALARMRTVELDIQDEPNLLAAGVEHLQRLLHLFAAGFYESADAELLQRLQDHRPQAAAAVAPSVAAAPVPVDEPEAELFSVFAEEAQELLAELRQGLANWVRQPGQGPAAATCMRALHTLKGGARLAGAMRLGERAHQLESRLEDVLPGQDLSQAETLLAEVDALHAAFDELRARLEPAGRVSVAAPLPAAEVVPLPVAELASPPAAEPALPPAAESALPPAAAFAAPADREELPEQLEMAGLPEVAELAEPLETAEPLARPAEPEPSLLPQPSADLADTAGLEAPYVEWPGEEEEAAATAPAVAELDSSFPELAWPEAPQPAPAAEAPVRPEVTGQAPPLLQPAPLPAAPLESPALAELLAQPQPQPEVQVPLARPEAEPAEAAAAADAVAPWPAAEPPAVGRSAVPMRAMVRVRAELMDRLFNQAGEVGTARSTIESEVARLKGSVVDLADNLERLRRQLRDLESQGEARAPRPRPGGVVGEPQFDPLELDRYTRFQELVRMMAESLDDIATIQRGLTLGVQGAEDGLAAQTQAARALLDDLLRTRLVEFESIADRLHRVARQAARETGRQVRLELDGASIELDRGVLDRMGAPFEHLVRNCVVHGLETPAQRGAAGKSPAGTVRIGLAQEGNEVVITVEDDGRGLDYVAIRARALDTGLIGPDDEPDEAALAELVFSPGLSTARGVTELAGRGIGLDVVRAEVLALGGRIELSSTPGQGTQVRITLPLTTAITQAVLLRLGDSTVAVPSTIVEIVRRVTPADIERACDSGTLPDGEAGATLPFYWLGALLDGPARPSVVGRAPRVVVLRSASQRVALFVDDILGHQEVVVKHLGPQLARLPGLAGMTVLASGEMVPIYNPVALAAMHGLQARERQRVAAVEGGEPAVTSEPSGPLVLVVDDSLTVRKVTQRLLLREGYRTAVAKDGMEALERIAEEKPAMVLSDLEMPRMDGFDLVRNLRADPRFADLPVVIITSRIAQKHRDHAVALGVDQYLGKPFVERELLALVARHTGFPASR